MDRLNLDKFKILAAAATLAMFAGTACAETELYGWVNRAIMHTSDGYEGSTLFVDNAFNASTLGVKSMGHLNKCVLFGADLSALYNVNSSRMVSQINNVNDDSFDVVVRTADAWVDGGVWGKLSLGYGYAASYKIMQMSYSGTDDTVSSAEVANLAGGMVFHPSSGPASAVRATYAGGPTVAAAFNAPDGVGSVDSLTGRYAAKNRIRYDSDKWNGLGFAISYGSVQTPDVSFADNDDFNLNSRSYTDAALRYEGNFCDFMLSAGVAWAKYTRDGGITAVPGFPGGVSHDTRLWSGSIAGEHKCTGLNVAVAYGNVRKQVAAASNNKVWFFQVGDRLCLTHYGKTNVVLDYYYGKDALINGDNSKSYAVGVVQDFDKVNTSLYATVRGYQYNDGVNLAGARTNFDKIWVASAGFLFKFGAML